MLWYGKKNLKLLNKLNKKNYLKRLNFKMRSLNISLIRRIGYEGYQTCIHIPGNWNFLVFQSFNKFLNLNNPLYYFYVYSEFYFFYIIVVKQFLNIWIDNFSSNVFFFFRFKNSFYNLYWITFLNLFYSFSFFFFRKLKIRGKGYYIYKNLRNTVTFKFGYAHRIYVYSYFVKVKFLTKTMVFLFGINKNDIFLISQKIRELRPHNLFTGKGVRFTKQIIYKKIGKVSSYR